MKQMLLAIEEMNPAEEIPVATIEANLIKKVRTNENKKKKY